jgi:hypothetical protein
VALPRSPGCSGYFLGEIIELTAVFLLQAALVKAVQDVRDGRVDLGLRRPSRPLSSSLLVAAAGIRRHRHHDGLVLIIVPAPSCDVLVPISCPSS